MAQLKSNINTTTSDFTQNRAAMQILCAELSQKMQLSLLQDTQKHLSDLSKPQQLSARQRIELILDQDSPFLELMPLAACDLNDHNTVKCIGGIGAVSGKLTLLIAFTEALQDGEINDVTLQKTLRYTVIATENALPIVFLQDAPIPNLLQQLAHLEDSEADTKLGVTTIAVIFDEAAAFNYPSNQPDYTILIRNRALTQTADYLAADEHDAIRLVREIIQILPDTHTFTPNDPIKAPLYPMDDLLGILSTSPETSFEMREIIARIADGSAFTEFKPEYGKALITGFVQIHGYPIAIIANNGILTSEALDKGGQFVQLCNRQCHPLLFLHNVTGFYLDEPHQEDLIEQCTKMIYAVVESTVPAITLVLGASYGLANYAMCGRAFAPRFLFSFPNSRIELTEREEVGKAIELMLQAAETKTPYTVSQKAILKTAFVEDAQPLSSVYAATADLCDDGVIDPRETRNYLGFALATVYNTAIQGTNAD